MSPEPTEARSHLERIGIRTTRLLGVPRYAFAAVRSEADESTALSSTWWLIANELLEVCERWWSDSGNVRSGFESKSGGDLLAYPGDQPHHYGNVGRGKITFLSVVVVTPLGM